MPSIRTAIAVLGTTALVGGLASPALAQEATYPSDTGTTQTQKPAKKKGKKRAPKKLTDAQLTTVAEKLGTTLEALKTAISEVKAATKATEAKETKAQEDALLGEKLGKTAAEVKAAFDSVRPARPARGEGQGERPAKGECKKPAQGSGDTGTGSGDYPTGS